MIHVLLISLERVKAMKKIPCSFFWLLLVFGIFLPCCLAASVEYDGPIPGQNDRLGWSADGNRHDPDDWGATALALAIFAKQGWQDKLVHIDYNNWLPDNTPYKAAQEKISVVEGVRKFKFSQTKVFDCQTDLEAAIDNVAAEINKSSSSSRFWYVQAGPFEVAYLALLKADPDKRKYCILVSHSAANDRPQHWPGQHGKDDCVALGAKYFYTSGQGKEKFGGGRFHEWQLVDWMKNSPNPEYRWVYSRLKKTAEHKRGVLDASDGGMAFALATGDLEGNFSPKLKDFLGTDQEYVEFDAPPLFLLKADEAVKLRDIVAEAPYDKAYKTLTANADAALGDEPNPLEEIIYEGHVSNHPDRLNTVRHLQDMNKIYTLTWAGFVSGDSKYGAKAIEFVEAWAKKCKPSGNDVNDNKLLTCMFAYHMLRDEMTKAQKKEIGKWVKSIGDVQQKGWKDNKRGNHAGKRLKLIYFAAYLENDKDRIKWAQSKIQKVWDLTLFANGETYDLKRRDALSYHFSTVRAFLQIAHIGRLAGKDHYNQEADNGGSIAKSIDFALPYIKGEKIHPEWVNTIVKLDKERWAKAGDPYYKPGKPWDRWEGYKSLMLASVFDKSLYRPAEKLRQDKNKALPWYAVPARASLPDGAVAQNTKH
ncbi:MAG: hypothetical protein DRP66_04495 [Planctomycetota bacterium]|nr:MAG: hypothetical protein DRP66_04495 [Planctomycetota bacterium]